MPNKRKAGKKKLTFWLTEGEMKLIDLISEEMEFNKSDTIRHLISTYASQVICQSQKSDENKGKTKTKGMTK